MKFHPPIIFFRSSSTLCVNFMFLLLYVDLTFPLKISPPKCRSLAKFGPEKDFAVNSFDLHFYFRRLDCSENVLKIYIFFKTTVHLP